MNQDRISQLRASEQARISRMIRNSETGWLFYGPDGIALHLLSDEAEKLEREARRMLERHLAFMRFSMPLAGSAGVGLYFSGFGAYSASSELMRHACMAACAALGLIIAILMVHDFGYDWRIRRWQSQQAERLRRDGRGGVPEQTALHHRRHNLLREASLLCVLILFLRIGAAMLDPPQVMLGIWPDFALAISALVLRALGDRIDETHRRRKWFD